MRRLYRHVYLLLLSILLLSILLICIERSNRRVIGRVFAAKNESNTRQKDPSVRVVCTYPNTNLPATF